MPATDDSEPGRPSVGSGEVRKGPALPPETAAATLVIALTAWALVIGHRAHLLHFDAKAHLLVARRVLDNITPGWTQLGSVWLPLPHILNAVPAASDFLYQTGLFAGVLGLAFYVAGVLALAAAAMRATGDRWAAGVAAAVPLLNPGWLYLQATPMTEPLFLGPVAGLAYGVVRFRTGGRNVDLYLAAACAFLASLVRYEAWPIVAVAAVVAGLGGERFRIRPAAVLLGLGLALPVLLFGLHTWFASDRFLYVIDDGNLTEQRGSVDLATTQLADGIVDAFGLPLALLGCAAVAVVVVRRRDPLLAMAFACTGPAVVTFTAYMAGHPTKTRYPLLMAPAFALALAAVTRHRRLAQLGALAVAALQLVVAPDPLPVLKEATRDRVNVAIRRPAMEAFRVRYHGGRLLASMGSTAPVLWETRLPLREIVHEGNGHYWDSAVVDPSRYVAWVLLAEGDVLDQQRVYRRNFPEGFVEVWRGARLTLYERRAPAR